MLVTVPETIRSWPPQLNSSYLQESGRRPDSAGSRRGIHVPLRPRV